MTRYIYDKQSGEFVPAEEYRRPVAHTAIMNDITPFKTTDGTVISSRSGLREYERANNVRQCGNEWPGSGRAPAWFSESVARSKANRR